MFSSSLVTRQKLRKFLAVKPTVTTRCLKKDIFFLPPPTITRSKSSAVLVLRRPLDYDAGDRAFNLTIRATVRRDNK